MLVEYSENQAQSTSSIKDCIKLLNKLENEPYVLSFPTAAGLESEKRINYWL